MTCGPQKQRVVAMRPPSPGDIRDASHRAAMSSQHGNQRAACVCRRRPERYPVWVPEIQDLMKSEACLGCSALPTL